MRVFNIPLGGTWATAAILDAVCINMLDGSRHCAIGVVDSYRDDTRMYLGYYDSLEAIYGEPDSECATLYKQNGYSMTPAGWVVLDFGPIDLNNVHSIHVYTLDDCGSGGVGIQISTEELEEVDVCQRMTPGRFSCGSEHIKKAVAFKGD